MSVFVQAHALLRDVESYLINETSCRFETVNILRKHLWQPTKLFGMGVEEKLRGFSLWTVMFLFILVISSWLLGHAEIGHRQQLLGAVQWLVIVVPAFLVVFAMPSTYATGGVSKVAIQYVKDQLKGRNIGSIKEVEYIKKAIKPFEDRANARVVALKWVVGLLWAGVIYYYTKGAKATAVDVSVLRDSFNAGVLFVGSLFGYVCVWGYEAAINKVFRTIEFGCNDYASELDRPM